MIGYLKERIFDFGKAINLAEDKPLNLFEKRLEQYFFAELANIVSKNNNLFALDDLEIAIQGVENLCDQVVRNAAQKPLKVNGADYVYPAERAESFGKKLKEVQRKLIKKWFLENFNLLIYNDDLNFANPDLCQYAINCLFLSEEKGEQ